VDSPAQITAKYTISSDSYLGILNITVTTPGGTSEPAKFKIIPGAVVFQFGLPGSRARPATGASEQPYESFDVGIHAAQVPNPDGSETDAYLDVSFTDDQGRPVAVGDSYHSDMDNVDNPDDASEEPPNVTSYSFGLQRPEAGNYVLHIKSSKSGSFVLEIDTSTSSSHEGLAELDSVPTYPGSSFELNFVCHRDPFSVDIDSGGLQPPHGAFSFAQPLTSDVLLPAEEKTLGVVIYYDPVMDQSSFRALLDGDDRTSLFHVRSGELELVSIPLVPGQHVLTIQANNKNGVSSVQEFHIQH
jgi:hypothetical protein